MNQLSQESLPVQKALGRSGLVVLLVLLSAFVPLSMDLYLPALPAMAAYFGDSGVLTNLTIILFFVVFSVATLFWGPMSDKYGRRPILLIGLIVYAAASLLCALSFNIYMLIAARILQAIGAGAATATATAVTKDSYEGPKLERTIAVIQTISVIVPVIAPMLGAFLLRVVDWRGAFFAQAALGSIVVIMALLFNETIQERNTGGVFKTLGRLFVVLKNRRFTALLVIFALSGIGFMAYVQASTYIYQEFFGLSSQQYSYFFSCNAAMIVLGPVLYVWASSRFSRFTLVTASFVITAVAGVLISTVGLISPWAFALTLLPTTIMGSFIAPPSRFLMLSQQSGDTGSASSLIGAVGSIAGSLGMIIMSLNLGNSIIVIGVLNIIMSLFCGGAWLFFTSRPLLKDLKN